MSSNSRDERVGAPTGLPEVGRPNGGSAAPGWGSGLSRAALLLAVSFVGFLLIPNRLVAYLSLHVAPRARDALVLLWVALFFVFMGWLFVRLQRGMEK